jgi:S-adenosylmethionine synthetase
MNYAANSMNYAANVGSTNYRRTSEHVSQGHPDKSCDIFADSFVDAVLDAARPFRNSQGPNAPERQRTAIEMLAKDHLVIMSGEARMGPDVARAVDVDAIVRRKWAEIGYPDAEKITVLNHVRTQSPELQVSSDNEGAGDQGIMVGYATAETPTCMPAEYEAARSLCRKIQQLRAGDPGSWIRADAKTQVTLDEDGRVARVVIAVQHAPEFAGTTESGALQALFKSYLLEHAIGPVLGDVDPADVVVNGTGSFVIGGPIGDAGVVGRKIVVDGYGPHIAVGGGAFSGKDPTKVDRSAAYKARQIAKTAVALQVRGAKSVTVSLAYCIGLQQPEMVRAVTGDGVDISDWAKSRFPDLSPRAIAATLGLWRDEPSVTWRYQDTASFGHFGRSEFPWEQVAAVSD